jgi:hypothetical protein
MFPISEIKCAVYSAIVAVLLNLLLPYLAKGYATKEQVKPKNGANTLSFKSQIMHMLVHHSQVPLSSSLIVFLITLLSVLISYKARKILKF